MRLRCEKDNITIIPDNPIEIVYLESVFGIKISEEKTVSCEMMDLNVHKLVLRKKD